METKGDKSAPRWDPVRATGSNRKEPRLLDNTMGLPPLLVGKVTAVTGGVTGIGRVGGLCSEERMVYRFTRLEHTQADMALVVPGDCARVSASRRTSGRQPSGWSARRSAAGEPAQRRGPDHVGNRRQQVHYRCWGYLAPGDRQTVCRGDGEGVWATGRLCEQCGCMPICGIPGVSLSF